MDISKEISKSSSFKHCVRKLRQQTQLLEPPKMDRISMKWNIQNVSIALYKWLFLLCNLLCSFFAAVYALRSPMKVKYFRNSAAKKNSRYIGDYFAFLMFRIYHSILARVIIFVTLNTIIEVLVRGIVKTKSWLKNRNASWKSNIFFSIHIYIYLFAVLCYAFNFANVYWIAILARIFHVIVAAIFFLAKLKWSLTQKAYIINTNCTRFWPIEC